MYIVKTLVASTISILAATAVSAATYTFDLQNLNGYNPDPGDPGTLSGNELVITQGDLTGTFTGLYVENAGYDAGDNLTADAINDADSVQRYYNGLGVCNDGPCGSTGDPYHTVDGATSGIQDMVQMAFSDTDGLVDVTLVSLTFGWIGDFQYGYAGTNGSFEIILDDFGLSGIDAGDSLVYSGIATINLDATRGRGLYDLAGVSGLFGDTFGVMAGDMGSWKLLSVVVDWTDVPEVPLPAAGWLLIGGLGGLAMLRRR